MGAGSGTTTVGVGAGTMLIDVVVVPTTTVVSVTLTSVSFLVSVAVAVTVCPSVRNRQREKPCLTGLAKAHLSDSLGDRSGDGDCTSRCSTAYRFSISRLMKLTSLLKSDSPGSDFGSRDCVLFTYAVQSAESQRLDRTERRKGQGKLTGAVNC